MGDMEKCPHSVKQVDTCKALGLNMKGAILCNETDHAKSDACVKVPAFPCFCNLDSNVCISGYRDTQAQFDELQKISDNEMTKKK